MKKNYFYLCLIFLFLMAGCKKDGDHEIETPEFPEGLTDTQKVNKFVVECTEELYLWEAQINWWKFGDEETYLAYTDPHALLEEMRYKDDRWSMLTEDVAGLYSVLDGVTTTYGYQLARGEFTNTKTYFAIIMYLSPGSPAEKAGLKRGDIIIGINGKDITQSNFMDLFESSSITLTMGVLGENGVSANPVHVNMTAVNMYENPINTVKIIEKDEHIIGYLCYTGYIDTSEPELSDVFREFQNAGVTDVILDLRYNGGGYARTAQYLSSLLAPYDAVKKQEVYLTRKWNALYNNYWEQHGGNDELFVDTLAVNMDLKRLYVLVTGNTASASEATIIGLSAYLDEIVLVGEETHGKFYGGFVLSIDEYYEGSPGYEKEYYQNVSNWGYSIITYRYANKNNYPNFSGGLTPQIAAEEDFFDLKPFGDETDPLLGRAIEHITGEPFVETHATALRNLPPHKVDATLKRPTDGVLIHKDTGLLRRFYYK